MGFIQVTDSDNNKLSLIGHWYYREIHVGHAIQKVLFINTFTDKAHDIKPMRTFHICLEPAEGAATTCHYQAESDVYKMEPTNMPPPGVQYVQQLRFIVESRSVDSFEWQQEGF